MVWGWWSKKACRTQADSQSLFSLCKTLYWTGSCSQFRVFCNLLCSLFIVAHMSFLLRISEPNWAMELPCSLTKPTLLKTSLSTQKTWNYKASLLDCEIIGLFLCVMYWWTVLLKSRGKVPSTSDNHHNFKVVSATFTTYCGVKIPYIFINKIHRCNKCYSVAYYSIFTINYPSLDFSQVTFDL